MKRYISVIMVLVLTLSIVGCSSSAKYSDDIAVDTNESAYDYAVEIGGSDYEYGAKAFTAETESERKVIKRGNIDLQTLEYEKSLDLLREKVKSMGGYIESSTEYGRDIYNKYSTRTARFTVRLPKDQFEVFIQDLASVGTIIQKNTSGEDVTSQIFDHEARVKTLNVQEERLLDILSKAEKVEDIIVLESELSRVRYEIENLNGTLKRLNDLVALSTLNVSIDEVREITEDEDIPETLGEKISDRFSRSVKSLMRFFERLVIWAIGSIPLLLIYIPIIVVIVVTFKLVKGYIKRKRSYFPTKDVMNTQSDKKDS